MRDNKFVQALAAAVTLGALGAIALTSTGGFPPRLQSEPHEASGWGLARQTVALLRDGGEVMVITRDTSAFKNPAMDVQLASFKKELRKAKVTINRIEALQVDPLRPLEVPPGDFLEWIRQSPPGSVIVSLMGPPLLTPAQRAQLKEVKPKIIAFCPGNLSDRVNLRILFEQGLLHAAVVSRRNPSSTVRPDGMQKLFDHLFMTITAENVGDVSLSATGASNFKSP